MFKTIALVVFILFQFRGQAQHAGYNLSNHPETFRKSFADATAATESIQSDFSQEKMLTMLSEKINSTGKFWYRRKDKLRMEYIHPYPYLMILSGGKIFVKDGQKENQFSANSGKVFQQVNRILIDCVSGNMLSNPDFQARVFENTGSFLIEFQPTAKNLKELYKNINIVVDKKDYTATVVEMNEVSGDKTIIRFQNKVFNAPIPDSVFNIP
ncbi:MAG TPA: outer membrane lipoprotein carrier protein LolA [Puia sp.]|nr:outer membrane lipoprotein carrier protein LolA [Puia sp.]